MNSRLLVLAIFLGLLASSVALIVTGRAEAHVNKKQIDIEFVVKAEDKDPSKALEKVAKEQDKLVNALKKFAGEDGITSGDAQIEAVLDDNGALKHYVSTVEVELDLKDSKSLGKAIEAGSKFATLQDVEYEVDESEEEEVKANLAAEAFKDAQEKAKVFAEKMGIELGEIDTIEVEDLSEEEDDYDESSDTDVEVTILYTLDDDEDDEGQEGEKKEEQPEEAAPEKEAEPEPVEEEKPAEKKGKKAKKEEAAAEEVVVEEKKGTKKAKAEKKK